MQSSSLKRFHLLYSVRRHPLQINITQRDTTQDWNAIIHGVHPHMNKKLVDHGIKFCRTIRITSSNGDKTHMVRIYILWSKTAKNAIFSGINHILDTCYAVVNAITRDNAVSPEPSRQMPLPKH